MEHNKVTITDVDIPFGRVVGIILKWALASIPAMIIVSIISFVVIFLLSLVFGGIFGGLLGM